MGIKKILFERDFKQCEIGKEKRLDVKKMINRAKGGFVIKEKDRLDVLQLNLFGQAICMLASAVGKEKQFVLWAAGNRLKGKVKPLSTDVVKIGKNFDTEAYTKTAFRADQIGKCALFGQPSQYPKEATLDLHGKKNVTDEMLKDFLKNCSEIQYVDLRGCEEITDEGLKFIAEKCKGNLQVLKLAGNWKVTHEGFAHFKGNKELRALELSHLGIANTGLAAFKDCGKLEELSLASLGEPVGFFGEIEEVSDAGLACFKNCRNLKKLGLFGLHKISDKGLAHFRENRELRELVVQSLSIDITDAGFTQFKDCTKVRTFKIGSLYRVTDDIFTHLKGYKHLEDVTLSGLSGITAKGMKNFRRWAQEQGVGVIS